MVKFDDDESLGKTIAKRQMFASIGVKPLEKTSDLAFAAGARKFSSLCGFVFTTAAPNAEYKQFAIAFVSKLRSKIYHQATKNPSQWFIFRRINPIRVDVLDKKACLVNYGFDVDKFFDSDLFQKSLPRWEQAIKKGLDDAEKLKEKVSKKDTVEGREVQRYIDAIKQALPLMKSSVCNDKYYKLIDYDMRSESEDEQLVEKTIPAVANKVLAELEDKFNEAIEEVFKKHQLEDFIDQAKQTVQYGCFSQGYNPESDLLDIFESVTEVEEDDDCAKKAEPKSEEKADEEQLDAEIEEAMSKIYGN